MALTPERRAQLRIEYGLAPEPLKPKTKPAKLVTSGGAVVSDAVVRVAPEDKNAKGHPDRVIDVRRDDRFVTINMRLAEEQFAQRQQDRMRDRQLDPMRLGHWGPLDD